MASFLLVVSAFGGVYCLTRLKENRDKNELLAKAIKDSETQISELKGKGEQVQQLLTPDQRSLLTASHKLVANKTFGWSRLFADLENVMPANVAASRIGVENIYQDGNRLKAELELGVISRDYPAVMVMIERMNNSGLFLAELRGQDLQKGERITFTEYTFRIVYTPGYGYSTAMPSTDVAQNFQGGNAQ